MGRIGNKPALLFPCFLDRFCDPAGQQNTDAKEDQKAEDADKDTVPHQVSQGRLLAGDVRIDKYLPERSTQMVVAQIIFLHDAHGCRSGKGILCQFL